jgi:hypothetical protein
MITVCQCPHCGLHHEINPASLLAKRPRKPSPARTEAQKRATEAASAARTAKSQAKRQGDHHAEK